MILFLLYNATFFYDNIYSRSHKYLLTLPGELKIIDYVIRVCYDQNWLFLTIKTVNLTGMAWTSIKACSVGPLCNRLLLEPHTFMGLFISALGLMMIFEGIPYFCSPSHVKNFAQKINKIPDQVLRVIGLAIMLIGLAIVYFGRVLFENS